MQPHSEISREDNSKIADEFSKLKECDVHENESESEDEVDDLDDCAVEGGSVEEILDDDESESDEEAVESSGSDNDDVEDEMKESTSGLSVRNWLLTIFNILIWSHQPSEPQGTSLIFIFY